MKVAIDCDYAATRLKAVLLGHLSGRSDIEVSDLAYLERNEGDYPDVAFNLARRIQEKTYDRGILLCGTGQGVAMCACKVRGVYAGACSDVYSAERLRKSNNAQIIALGERVVGSELAKMIVDAWFGSEFQGADSAPKVDRMRELENESFSKPSEVAQP